MSSCRTCFHDHWNEGDPVYKSKATAWTCCSLCPIAGEKLISIFHLIVPILMKSIGNLNLLWKIVLTPVRAQSVDIYLDTVFCSLWCFHDAATRDCLRIQLFIPDTSSQWFSSLSLLHLMPAVAELCCCFPHFVLSEAVFWLIVRRVTDSREIWDYSAVPCLNAQCHALANPTEILGASRHLPWQCLLDVLLLLIFAEMELLRFQRARVHSGHQPLCCVLAERLPQQEPVVIVSTPVGISRWLLENSCLQSICSTWKCKATFLAFTTQLISTMKSKLLLIIAECLHFMLSFQI